MQKTDDRGRPRDPVYEQTADRVVGYLNRYPDSNGKEWAFDISPEGRPTDTLRARRDRFLGFRQSTVFKELKNTCKDKGFDLHLRFNGETAETAVVRLVHRG